MGCLIAGFLLVDSLILTAPAGLYAGSKLVTIQQTSGSQFRSLPFGLLRRISEDIGSLEASTGVFARPLELEHEGTYVIANAELVTRDFCRTLHPILRLGRCFSTDDARTSSLPVAILSYSAWQSLFGGSSDVLGRTVKLSGRPISVKIEAGAIPKQAEIESIDYQIIGVFSRELKGTIESDTAVWIPYERSADSFVGYGSLGDKMAALTVFGRLHGGASVQDVERDLNAHYRPGDQEIGLAPGARLESISGMVSDIGTQRATRRQVTLILGAGILLAIVAASNISLFLLSQSPKRARELSIRMAVGATTNRLTRQLINETLVLVALAALFGTAVSIWLAGSLRQMTLFLEGQWRSGVIIDWRAVLVVVGVAVLLSLLVSMAPIAGIKHLGISAASRVVRTAQSRVQLIAQNLQLAIAGIVAAGALAFVWYLVAMMAAEIGMNASGVIVISQKLPSLFSMRPKTPDQILLEREDIRRVISGIPGVRGVTFGTAVPGKVIPFVARVPRPGGRASEMVDVMFISADAAYPDVLGMRILYGRRIQPKELGAVIVNASLGKALWGRVDVVGELLGQSHMHIVGVVNDVRYLHPDEPPSPAMYRLISPASAFELVIVRTSLGLAEFRRIVESKVEAGQLHLDIASIQTLKDVWGSVLAADRERTALAAGCAVVVMLLTGLGFYGTQRYLAVSSRREYAIRAAVGAGPRRLRLLVVGRAFWIAVPGLVIGLALGLFEVSWMRRDLLSAVVARMPVAMVVSLWMLCLVGISTISSALYVGRLSTMDVLKDE